MLRPLLLSVLLATASASAQDTAPRPTAGQRLVLVGGAIAGGLVALPLGPGAVVGVPVGTYVTSAALGLDPTVGGVLIDTALGAAVGVGAWAATLYYVTEIADHPHDISADFGAAFTGLVVGAAATGLAHGVRLAVLRAPSGERVPGVSLRVGL